MAQAGLVPREAIEECAAKAGTFSAVDAARIDEIEKTTRHDVIAFLTFLEERIGPAARHLHFGMTSPTCSTPRSPSCSARRPILLLAESTKRGKR